MSNHWPTLLVLAALFPTSAAAQDATIDARAFVDGSRWRLYAVEFAHSVGVREARLVRDAAPDSSVEMSWYFFVVLGHGRVVLVDAGTDAFARREREALRTSWSVERAVVVTEALARLRLAPDDVTDIVLTHHHWDHVGGIASFPRARVHAHRGEWARVPARLRGPVERARRAELISRRSEELWPGFEVRVAGRHTRYQLMVELRCEDRAVVIASDAAYLYRNIEEAIPVAVTSDPARNVEDVARAARGVGGDNVIPGHDPAVFARYPSGVPGVAAICP